MAMLVITGGYPILPTGQVIPVTLLKPISGMILQVMTSASSSTSVDRPAFSASVKALLGMGQIKTKKAAPKLWTSESRPQIFINDMTWLK